ncbi:site-specific integrase [Adhaeribacter radiodurans]|uniref:Site-specific integrase n=1 Tax=Adhaeribacter radiodurans TaxID=2745197 RepID=A0A7L7L5P2_9BACT|nr:site-specific integrase [Adhaeribacter radiodurans]QMU28127.1 site-specific integrase [Adhaeribacter radiodurans]
MKDINTTVAVILYKSKLLSNGEHPLMLRVTKNRKVSYKSLGISCSAKYWNFEKNEPKKNHPKRALLESIINKKLSEYNDKALELKSVEREFTPASLIEGIERRVRKVTVFSFYQETIDRLFTSKQIGNANTYKDSYRSIRAFTKNQDLTFFELDYSFLIKYETYLRGNNLTDTSLSVYFRTLRAIYNRAIKENAARLQDYPFKVFQISKFDTSTRKRAISKEEIKNIEALHLPEKSLSFTARQYFLFSYYGSGINFIDIANLKWKDIVAGRLIYNRSKTGKELNFKLLEPAQRIIEHWQPITGATPENYIFPILDKTRHITPTQIDNRITKVIGQVNRELKNIGDLAGISTPLTTYVARHTFATVLKKSGVGTAIISESLGHASEAITQVYLKSFENSILDTAAENLL